MHSVKKGELVVELGGVFYLFCIFLRGAMDKRRKGKLFHIGAEKSLLLSSSGGLSPTEVSASGKENRLSHILISVFAASQASWNGDSGLQRVCKASLVSGAAQVKLAV